jgi:hypothetical protein
MHGSSSVPEEEVRRINAAGGKLDPPAAALNFMGCGDYAKSFARIR